MEQIACEKKRKFVISMFKHQNIIHDKLTTVAVYIQVISPICLDFVIVLLLYPVATQLMLDPE